MADKKNKSKNTKLTQETQNTETEVFDTAASSQCNNKKSSEPKE